MAAALNKQQKGEKTAVIANGRKKIHTTYVDDSELVEEYDVITDELLVRKLRQPSTLGGDGEWVYEIGTDESKARAFVPDFDLLKEAAGSPQLSRKDTAEDIVFRIRNLAYPKSVFSVTIEGGPAPQDQNIVVRTSNKKYFKKIEIPEMRRAGVALESSNLSWEHQLNTLIISYKKHQSMRIAEALEKKDRSTIQATRIGSGHGDPTSGGGCPQQ